MCICCNHKSCKWFMITTYIHLLCIYYAAVEKTGPTSRLKVNLTSNFILMIYQSAVIVSYENEAHRNCQDGSVLSLVAVIAHSHFVEPCGCSLSSSLKDEGPIFLVACWLILWQEINKSGYLPFSPGEISAGFFSFGNLFLIKRKVKRESGWTDTGKCRGFTDIFFSFLSKVSSVPQSTLFSLQLAWKHGPDKDQMVFVSSRMDYWVVSHLKLNANITCKFWLLKKLDVHLLKSSSLCSHLCLTGSQRVSRRTKGSSLCYIGHSTLF